MSPLNVSGFAPVLRDYSGELPGKDKPAVVIVPSNSVARAVEQEGPRNPLLLTGRMCGLLAKMIKRATPEAMVTPNFGGGYKR